MLAAVLAVSGCTGEPDANGGRTGQIIPQSPLDEYMNAIAGTELSFEEQTRRADERNARYNEIVTQCMHDRGFDFDIDNLPAGMHFGVTSVVLPDNSLDRENPDWVSQWGYGIMASPDRAENEPIDIWQGPVLSDSELEAFTRALTGRGLTPPFDEFDENNCADISTQQWLSEMPEGLSAVDEFAPIFDSINQMQDEFRQQVSNADIRWAQCMAEAGYPGFQRQWEAEESIRTQMLDVLNRRGTPAELEAAEEAFRLKEVELAVADLSCRESTGFTAERNADRIAFETQFVEDNRAALEALRAAAEQLQ